MEIDPKAVRNGVTLAEAIERIETGDTEEGLNILKQWKADEPSPCPCCGAPAEVFFQGANAFIQCSECYVRSPSGELEDALRVWNRRAEKTE